MKHTAEQRKYRRRVWAVGLTILAASFLMGIFLSFYQWDRGSPFARSSWGYINPLGRATIGPLGFALVLFPITIPVLLVLSVPIYYGMKREKLWPLSILGFLGIGVLWVLFVTDCWEID